MNERVMVALPVKKVSQINRPRSWAIYGRSGSGKTTFSGTFPGPILLLDFRDRGTDSVRGVKNLDVMEIEDWEEVEDVYLFLSKNKKKYNTVVFDTITQMQGIAVEHVLAKKKKKTDKAAGDWGTMTMREWGDVSSMMKEKITLFRDLPMEVAFLAQERVKKDDNSEEGAEDMLIPEVGPALTPSVASHLNASVSVIGNSFIRVRRKVTKDANGKKKETDVMTYCLRLGAHPVYTTKVRKDRDIEAPAFVEDPTWKDVVDILEGK